MYRGVQGGTEGAQVGGQGGYVPSEGRWYRCRCGPDLLQETVFWVSDSRLALAWVPWLGAPSLPGHLLTTLRQVSHRTRTQTRGRTVMHVSQREGGAAQRSHFLSYESEKYNNYLRRANTLEDLTPQQALAAPVC